MCVCVCWGGGGGGDGVESRKTEKLKFKIITWRSAKKELLHFVIMILKIKPRFISLDWKTYYTEAFDFIPESLKENLHTVFLNEHKSAKIIVLPKNWPCRLLCLAKVIFVLWNRFYRFMFTWYNCFSDQIFRRSYVLQYIGVHWVLWNSLKVAKVANFIMCLNPTIHFINFN